MGMEKIIVTEEQAKYIEEQLNLKINDNYKAWNIAVTTNLDVMTVARIVTGELYEINRPFKIDDIVGYNNDTSTWVVVEINPFTVSAYTEAENRMSLERKPEDYFLVAKAENREDKKEEGSK
jgi:hypothetical protein